MEIKTAEKEHFKEIDKYLKYMDEHKNKQFSLKSSLLMSTYIVKVIMTMLSKLLITTKDMLLK